MFKNLLQLCLEEENCDAYQFWGVIDKYSWLADGQNGLPWDSNYQPKVAFTEMLNALNSFDKSSVNRDYAVMPWRTG